MLRFVVLVVLLATFASSQTQFQTLPAGWETTQGGGATSWPFNTPASQRWQWSYDSSQFASAACITIQEIYVRAAQIGTTIPAYNMSNVEIRLASARTDYGIASYPGDFDTALLPDASLVRSGPLSGPALPPGPGGEPAWIPLGLQSGFDFDPSLGNDLVIDITRCGGGTDFASLIDMATGAVGVTGGLRYGHVSDCQSPTWNFTHQGAEWVPIVRIAYLPSSQCSFAPQWMRNSAELTLTNDGNSANDPAGPITSSACVGVLRLIGLDTTLGGLPWEIAMVETPALPAFGGGVPFAPGQALNLDATHPSFFLAATSLFTLPPPPFPLTIPYVGTSPGTLSAQFGVLDPASPAGLRLSAAAQLETVGAQPLVFPAEDDASTFVDLSSSPVCIGGGIEFYGASYSGFFVSSNGRVSFGSSGIGSFPSPTQALAGPPFVGAWTDLQPNVSGSITLTQPVAGLIQIEYLQVPYFGLPLSTATMSIVLDTTNGFVALVDLTGIQSAPVPMFLGISAGNLGATDPGTTGFVPFSLPSAPPGSRPMIYDFGDAGSVAPGVWAILFVPDGNGAYLQTSF